MTDAEKIADLERQLANEKHNRQIVYDHQQDVIEALALTLRDRFTMAALTGILARSISPRAAVEEAMRVAEIAMEARKAPPPEKTK